MKSSLSSISEWDSVESFCILAAYEDLFTHNRVREVCDRLLDQYWGDLEFDFNWWSFKSLSERSSRAEAVAIAAEANLIIVAAHASPSLPPHVERWIEAWVPSRLGREGLLAALVGLPEEQGAAPILTYLQQVAHRARLDFLPNASKTPPRRLTPKPAPLNQRQLFTEDLRRLLDPRRPPMHWGINE